jgi:DnaK suppressor protein
MVGRDSAAGSRETRTGLCAPHTFVETDLAGRRQRRPSRLACPQPGKVRLQRNTVGPTGSRTRSAGQRPVPQTQGETLMPASSTSSTVRPALLHAVPLCSRSHGGRGAGSSDRPGRRSPLGSSSTGGGPDHRRPTPAGTRPSAGAPPVGLVNAARRKLGQQRAFRINQLNQLEAARDELATDAARAEIDCALQEAARVALEDIEAALRRIEQGSYGRCHGCGDAMSLGRLDALPMAAVCGSCQRRQELLTVEPN